MPAFCIFVVLLFTYGFLELLGFHPDGLAVVDHDVLPEGLVLK